MKTAPQKESLPEFDREAVFAEVDASNRRFEDYTKEQREQFAAEARAPKAVTHEARRPRH